MAILKNPIFQIVLGSVISFLTSLLANYVFIERRLKVLKVQAAAGGLSLVGGWLGAYLGSYLKKKGENLATHEDIDKLVDQVRAVTQTTKEIEAKISNEVWDRQKRWTQTIYDQAAKRRDASNALDESRLLATVVCSEETRKTLESFGMLTNQVAGKISQKDAQAYPNSAKALAQALFTVQAALRKELGIETVASPPVSSPSR